jgi:hypothetical protein
VNERCECPDIPAWTENLLFSPYDAVNDVGMWLHLGTVADKWEMWEDRVLVALPGRGGRQRPARLDCWRCRCIWRSVGIGIYTGATWLITWTSMPLSSMFEPYLTEVGQLACGYVDGVLCADVIASGLRKAWNTTCSSRGWYAC